MDVFLVELRRSSALACILYAQAGRIKFWSRVAQALAGVSVLVALSSFLWSDWAVLLATVGLGIAFSANVLAVYLHRKAHKGLQLAIQNANWARLLLNNFVPEEE